MNEGASRTSEVAASLHYSHFSILCAPLRHYIYQTITASFHPYQNHPTCLSGPSTLKYKLTLVGGIEYCGKEESESVMADTGSVSSSNTNSNLSRKKRKKAGSGRISRESSRARWRTETEQRIYSSKLVDALRNLGRPDPSTVRDAADKVLAVSAKGRTRWSRAILTGRLSFRLSQINRRHKKATKPVAASKKPAARKNLPPLQRKVKALSRLIPGCRKLSLPNLLEETTDYIAALEMQVKAMAVITGILNGDVLGDFPRLALVHT